MKIAEIQLNYIRSKETINQHKISNSKDTEAFFRGVWSNKMDYIEEFYLLLLNRNNSINGYINVSKGGTAGTVVDLKIVFQAALKTNSQGIIMAHNHPSGNTKPSEADIILTKRIKEAGKLMEIQILDHIILTAEGYFSFADEGMM